MRRCWIGRQEGFVLRRCLGEVAIGRICEAHVEEIRQRWCAGESMQAIADRLRIPCEEIEAAIRELARRAGA